METLTLLVDTIAVVLAVYYSYKNEQRPEGTPEIGFFRIKPDTPPPAPSKLPAATRRRRRL